MIEFGMPYLLEMQSIEECAGLAHELGLRFVELNANFPDCLIERLDPSELERLRSKYQVYFTLHLEEECNPLSFNTSVRSAWLESFCQGLKTAVDMHMPIVNMHFPQGIYITLPDQKVHLYERYHKEFFSALSELRNICEEILTGTSTCIAIENTSSWKEYERSAIEYLLESPVFGLTLDIGHSHGVENIDIPFFRHHDDRLIHMHGHDGLGKKNHLALGDGEIDLPERFAWAARRKARIVLETKTIAALRTSVSRLPEILSEIAEKS